MIKVRVNRRDFARALGDMRTWLDRHNEPLLACETASDGDAVMITIRLNSPELSQAFERQFSGETRAAANDAPA